MLLPTIDPLSSRGLNRMTKSERKDYWRRFLERLRREGLLLTEREPYESTWQIIDEWSRHQIRLSARLNSEKHWIHIDLTFSGPNRYEHFDRLNRESGKYQEIWLIHCRIDLRNGKETTQITRGSVGFICVDPRTR